MFARIASFEGGDTEQLRKMNEERQASGSMGLPAGVRRVLMLDDAGANRRLFVTFFDSPEEIAAAETQFDSMGDEIPEDVRGRRTSVEQYEVVFEQET